MNSYYSKVNINNRGPVNESVISGVFMYIVGRVSALVTVSGNICPGVCLREPRTASIQIRRPMRCKATMVFGVCGGLEQINWNMVYPKRMISMYVCNECMFVLECVFVFVLAGGRGQPIELII